MWPGGGWWRFGHHQSYEVVKTEMWAIIIIYYWIFSPLLMVTAVPAFVLPMWNNQPNVTTATGRNIRQLPCVSRRTGETGLCMFAYSCAKANGTHLGTCIDRFYFGSCCKVANYELEITESILNNYITSKDDFSSSTMKTPYNKNTGAFSFGTTNDGVRSTTITSSTPASSVSYSVSSSTSSSPFVTFTTNAKSPSIKPGTQSSISSSSTQFYGSSSVSSHAISTSNSYTPSVSIISTTSSSPTVFQSASQTISSKPVKPGTKPKPLNTSTQKPSSKPKPTKVPIKLTSTSSVSLSSQASFPSSSIPPSKINFNTSSSGYFVTTTSNKPTYSTTYESSKPTKISNKPSISSSKPSTSSSSRKPSPSGRPTIGSSSSQSTTASYLQVPLSTVTQSSKPSTATSLLSNYTEIINSLLHTVSTGSTSTIPSTPSQIFNVSQNEHLFTENPSTSKTRPDSSNSPSTTSQLWASSTAPQPPLITWTTINDVPVIPSDRTKPTGKPSMKPTSPFTTSTVNRPSSIKPTDATIGTPLHHQTTSKIEDTSFNTSQTPSWVEISLTTHAPSVSHTSSTAEETPSTISTEKLSLSSASIGTTNKIPSSSFTSTEESLSPTTSFSSIITNMFPDSILNTTISPSSTSASMDTNEIENSSINMSNYREVCGRRLFPVARIVGGEKSTFGKWPWQISLRQWRTSTYLHKCGAALFNENWAVTAAHCVENVPPSDLLLRLGEHDLSSEDEPYGYQERRVQIVASHPQFDPRTFEYDLALLRFYEPVKFQPNIIPICVPTDDTNFVGSTAYVTGWGRLYEDGPLPSVLQEVTVPVIDNGMCENMYRTAGYVEHIPGIFICAGWKKGGFDSCEGDSGGPMVIQKPDKRWLLAGIISWGIGCAEPNQPGVYTRISEFRDWINQILQF